MAWHCHLPAVMHHCVCPEHQKPASIRPPLHIRPSYQLKRFPLSLTVADHVQACCCAHLSPVALSAQIPPSFSFTSQETPSSSRASEICGFIELLSQEQWSYVRPEGEGWSTRSCPQQAHSHSTRAELPFLGDGCVSSPQHTAALSSLAEACAPPVAPGSWERHLVVWMQGEPVSSPSSAQPGLKIPREWADGDGGVTASPVRMGMSGPCQSTQGTASSSARCWHRVLGSRAVPWQFP